MAVEFTTAMLKEPEPGKQLEYFDAKLASGFGIRVGGRSKTFFRPGTRPEGDR